MPHAFRDTSLKRLATGNNRLRLSNQKGGYNWLEVGAHHHA
jgi:hypothetical protein